MKIQKSKTLIIATILVLAATGIAYAGITMTLDRDMVDFRTMEKGETREISDQGVYHNQVTCTSTNDKTWYLKVHTIRGFSSGAHVIPNEHFQWKVVTVVNGKGIVNGNINQANSFQDMSSLVYTSDPLDNTGTEVKLQFRYILTVPKNQIAGNYFASVRWTMTELL